MQSSIPSETKASKYLSLGGNREKKIESVIINFLNDNYFTLEGEFFDIWNSDSYTGDTYDKTYFFGAGNYEILSNNNSLKYNKIKLNFCEFRKEFTDLTKESDNRKTDKTSVDNVTLILNIVGIDLYFEPNEFFKLLIEKNKYEIIWEKEINMLERCGISKEDALVRVRNYFEDIKSQNYTYKYSYSYCVVDDLIFEIFEKNFPDAWCTSQICHMFKDFMKKRNYDNYDFCVLWKNSDYNLSKFVKLNHIEDQYDSYLQKFNANPNFEKLKKYI